MNTPAELFYTESDEWVRLEDDGTVTVGITDYAQDSLGEIVYLELPQVGDSIAADGSFGVAESVKAVGDLHCPFAGEVLAINEEALSNFGLLNESPYGDGWLIKIKPTDTPDTSALLSAESYSALHD